MKVRDIMPLVRSEYVHIMYDGFEHALINGYVIPTKWYKDMMRDDPQQLDELYLDDEVVGIQVDSEFNRVQIIVDFKEGE